MEEEGAVKLLLQFHAVEVADDVEDLGEMLSVACGVTPLRKLLRLKMLMKMMMVVMVVIAVSKGSFCSPVSWLFKTSSRARGIV